VSGSRREWDPLSAPEPTPDVARLKPYTVPAAGRHDCLRLDFNESLLGPSPRVLERLRRIEVEDISLYPDETEARAAVARHFGLDRRPELDFVLTSGVDEGIRLVCDCFVRAGERVALVDPGYAMYRFYATLAGADIVSVDCNRDLSFPAAQLRAAAAGCRLVIVGNPHNPTGAPAPAGFVEDLAAAFPGAIVLADEAYAEFAGDSSVAALRRLPNLIVARTFSKAYGLAGLRAGVLLGDRAALQWVARMRSPYAVNSIALLALTAALEDEAWMTRYVAEVRAARFGLEAALRALGIPTYPSAANFLVARFGDRAPAIRAALRRRGILVRDRGDHPLMRGTLRIGVGTREQVGAFLAALGPSLAEAAQAVPAAGEETR
jgi:histidinol-phosphate aminotransferase